MSLLHRWMFAVVLGGVCEFGQADPQQAMLRLALDFGERPTARLTLGFRSRLPASGPHRDPVFSLPLLSYRDGLQAPLLRAAEDSQTFCERSRTGCIAFASLIGVGIFFVVTQYEHDSENTRTVVVINTGQTESRSRSALRPTGGGATKSGSK